MRRFVALAAVPAAIAWAGACASFSAGAGGGVTEVDAADAGGPEVVTDAAVGMVIVAVGDMTFLIDSVEVSSADFARFTASKPQPPGSYTAACSWKSFYGPSIGNCTAAGGGDLPATCVDWCDAFAYCAWANKRLCGKIGGGATTTADSTNPAVDQWTRACVGSAPDAGGWPYGSSGDPARCNTAEHEAGKPVVSGSLKECSGPVGGSFDMSGNVYEWEDACEPDDAGTESETRCLVRGGGYVTPTANSGCQSFDDEVRRTVAAGIGFRCCKDVP